MFSKIFLLLSGQECFFHVAVPQGHAGAGAEHASWWGGLVLRGQELRIIDVIYM